MGWGGGGAGGGVRDYGGLSIMRGMTNLSLAGKVAGKGVGITAATCAAATNPAISVTGGFFTQLGAL